VAGAGAAAALSGLIFVAVSINLREILAEEKKLGSSCAAGSAISPARAARAFRSTHVKPVAFSLRMLLSGLLVAGYAAAGATLLAQAGGGLHWLPVAFVLAVTIAASNAWVLLVEVLR
jgi:hypothetical protein